MRVFRFAFFGVLAASASTGEHESIDGSTDAELEEAADILVELSSVEVKPPSLLRLVAEAIREEPRRGLYGVTSSVTRAGYIGDVTEVEKVMRQVLYHIERPAWFHEALAQQPADLDETRLVSAIRIASPRAQEPLANPAAIRSWLAICIDPLRAGRARCGPKNGSTWALHTRIARAHVETLINAGVFDE